MSAFLLAPFLDIGFPELLLFFGVVLTFVLIFGIALLIFRGAHDGANQKVSVPNKQDLETSISSYIAQGFVVMNKTETSAVLIKKKEFSIPIGIIGFLLCIVGLIVYAIIYAGQKDEVVAIVIS